MSKKVRTCVFTALLVYLWVKTTHGVADYMSLAKAFVAGIAATAGVELPTKECSGSRGGEPGLQLLQRRGRAGHAGCQKEQDDWLTHLSVEFGGWQQSVKCKLRKCSTRGI